MARSHGLHIAAGAEVTARAREDHRRFNVIVAIAPD
jgi:hypothetical protein